MQHYPAGDYINWLRQQEGQLRMEEAQLFAEEQWLRQKEVELQQQQGARIAQAVLFALAKSNRSTPYQRQRAWLNRKWADFHGKRIALQARRSWLQAEKMKLGLP